MATQRQIKELKRLLVIPPRFIGDSIMAQALVSSIQERHPLCQIHLLVTPVIQQWFEHCPNANELHIVPDDFKAQLQLIQRIKPDTILILRRSLSDALCAFLAGVRNRVGFSSQRLFKKYRNTSLFLTHVTPYPALLSTDPHLKLLGKILSHFDVETIQPPQCFHTREDELLVQFILEKYQFKTQPVVAIHLASASREKELSSDKFVSTMRYLAASGFKIIAIGSEAERPYYTQLQEKSQVSIINMCGETPLRVSALLLEKCDLLLSLDSGPVHMAAVTGCPNIITLYGPTSETQWAPWPYKGNFTAIYNTALTCRPCVPKICEHNLCREELTDTGILQQVKQHVCKYMAKITGLTVA